jgi:hypothetical protein
MKTILTSLVIVLLVAVGSAGLLYGQTTHDVFVGGPCPPNVPNPNPDRVYLEMGDFVKFTTNDSCDFWVRGDAPIGEIHFNASLGDSTATVGPFGGKYTNWNYWVVDGAGEQDSVEAVISVYREQPTLTQWGIIALVILILVSAVFIMVRRKKAAVPA